MVCAESAQEVNMGERTRGVAGLVPGCPSTGWWGVREGVAGGKQQRPSGPLPWPVPGTPGALRGCSGGTKERLGQSGQAVGSEGPERRWSHWARRASWTLPGLQEAAQPWPEDQ